jgi:hypothetical protein
MEMGNKERGSVASGPLQGGSAGTRATEKRLNERILGSRVSENPAGPILIS